MEHDLSRSLRSAGELDVDVKIKIGKDGDISIFVKRGKSRIEIRLVNVHEIAKELMKKSAKDPGCRDRTIRLLNELLGLDISSAIRYANETQSRKSR